MSVEGNGQLGPTMASLPRTEHFRARPVMSRLSRRWSGHRVDRPTEDEKRDAILVLAEGWTSDHPRHDPLYAEAERIFEEASRDDEPLWCACIGPIGGGERCPCRQFALDRGEPWEVDR